MVATRDVGASRLEVVLNKYVAELDAAHESATASAPPCWNLWVRDVVNNDPTIARREYWACYD